VDRALERAGQLTIVQSARDFAEKIKLVRRVRPVKVPAHGARALESILEHVEEILSLEYAANPARIVRAAGPALQPSEVRLTP
jgi:hypothetical protein